MNTSPSSRDANAPWQSPALSCDVVMKGGITSGIVYPGAIVELAKRYTFRSIGGASAGAIAAAATAAAEYGREVGGGFARLDRVPDELGTTDSGESRLLQMFVPEHSTKNLFDAALGFVRFGKLRGVWGLVRAFPRFPLIALALAVVAAALALFGPLPWWIAVALVGVATWILVVGLLRDAYVAFRRVADNDFGLCRLGPRSSDPNAKPLTLWLYELLQDVAGKPHDAPLTFADLWGVDLPSNPDDLTDETRERLERLGWDTSGRRIDLQVMTTNLTNGRPMRLPIGRTRYENRAEDGGGLLFDPDEWDELFPVPVMKHLRAYGRVPTGERKRILDELAPGNGLRVLPSGYALPVVVAARMSLSFPVLISVVPLWDIRYRGGAPEQLRRVLFSDGGIASNFPVHFFDAPLPRRPTFAINLAGFEPDDPKPDPKNPGASVVDPVPATGRARETWKEIGSMSGLFVAIKDAMQNWRDNSQARLPGFRERVIHVKLAGGEGGLNLAMKREKIVELNGRGRHAGIRLVELFSGPADGPPILTESWDHHRWARLRVSLSALERIVRGFRRAYTELEPNDSVTPRYDERILRGTVKPYAFGSNAQQAFAVDTVAAYGDLVLGWGDDKTLDDEGQPHPVPALRLVPPV